MHLTTRVNTQTDWTQIAALVKADALQVGDEITDTLKNGEPITYAVAHVTRELVHFISKDCLNQKFPWNKKESHQQSPGSFRDSYLCKALNETVWELLPDALQAVITPRECVQIKDAGELRFFLKLWLPTEYEVFGKTWACGIPEGEQLEIFRDRRNRTKGAGHKGGWDAWWTMSSGGNTLGSASDIAYQSIVNYFGGDRTSYFANQHAVPICFSIRRG